MLRAAGQDVLSARGSRPTDAPSALSAGVELSARRRAAVKKAFKRLDPSGTGQATLEDIRTVLSTAPFHPSAQQKVSEELGRFAERSPNGALVISHESFTAYYRITSPAIFNDGDFEKLLHAQWGFADVSDILISMQRQFAVIGFQYAFQECGPSAGELGGAAFEAALKKSGITPRQDDLQRLYRAFHGQSGGIRLDEFKEQLLSPRPETPTPHTRDLAALTPVGGPSALSPGLARPLAATSPGGRPSSGSGRHRPYSGKIFAPPGTASNVNTSLVPPSSSRAVGAADVGSGGGAAGGDGDLDAMLSKMENHLSHIKKHRAEDSGKPGEASSIKPGPRPAGDQSGGPVSDGDLDAMLSKMEGHLNGLKKTGDGSQAKSNLPDGPVSGADLDASLSHMEEQIHKIKAHKKVANATPHWDNNEPAPPPVDMPHWEHHKYGHHKITEPAWKPAAQVTDMYGKQHAAAEYGYSTYGAGSHGHHLAHYHLNDYHGLAHHSFKAEEYGKQSHGDAAHHGHWVPHLHGMGTNAHHGEHTYSKDAYHNQSYGKEEHSHWVPHLNGLGHSHRSP